MRYIVDDHLDMLHLKLVAVLLWSFAALAAGFFFRSNMVSAQVQQVADITGDGAVNFSDYKALVASYGASTGDETFNPMADVAPLPQEGGADGVINAFDMNILATYYGQ